MAKRGPRQLSRFENVNISIDRGLTKRGKPRKTRIVAQQPENVQQIMLHGQQEAQRAAEELQQLQRQTEDWRERQSLYNLVRSLPDCRHGGDFEPGGMYSHITTTENTGPQEIFPEAYWVEEEELLSELDPILEGIGIVKDRMRSRMCRRQVIRDEIATVVAQQAGQRPHRQGFT
jgi:hypothetical protein